MIYDDFENAKISTTLCDIIEIEEKNLIIASFSKYDIMFMMMKIILLANT